MIIVWMATLRDLREKVALSQEDLAEAARVQAHTISDIENRKHKPRPSTRRKIAKALGVRPQDIDW